MEVFGALWFFGAEAVHRSVSGAPAVEFSKVAVLDFSIKARWVPACEGVAVRARILVRCFACDMQQYICALKCVYRLDTYIHIKMYIDLYTPVYVGIAFMHIYIDIDICIYTRT